MIQSNPLARLTASVIENGRELPDAATVTVSVGDLREVLKFAGQNFVPGVWRCAKCEFTLLQSTMNAQDGTITARDEPGTRCPNDDSPMWRVSWKQWATEGHELAERFYHEAQELKAAAEVAQVTHKFVGQWRHIKRGTTYDLVGGAKAQASGDPIADDDDLIIYRDEAGNWWARKGTEFFDGRFVNALQPNEEAR